MSRHIFVFIDGTLARSETDTNIWKLYQLAGGSGNRDARYQEGIAAMSDAKRLQTFFPTEINAEAYQQYKILDALDVEATDRLYIFGYSRGAIIARILAQMITSDVARASVVSRADQVVNVRRNTVDFLGLFDPVRGRPSFFDPSGFDSDVYKNTSIMNISEIVSIDEGFPFLKSDASIAAHTPAQSDSSIISRITGSRENSTGKAASNRTFTRRSSRHYCLMPGVHGDIGGQEANIALSRVSLFQMLGDFLLAFPDVEPQLDADRLQNLRLELRTHDTIKVGERTRLYRKLLRIKRKFRSEPSATVHPVVGELQGKKGISNHLLFGKWRRYRVPSYFSDWPIAGS